MADLIAVPIAKAGNKAIEVDPSQLSDEMYHLALVEGLKVILNKGISSTKYPTKGLEGEELASQQIAVYAKAEENLQDLYAGKVRKGRASAATSADGKKIPGVVMTEARRLAKEVVKDEIRAAGMKVSHVEASEITKLANAMIAADPSFIEMARANIEARTAKVPQGDTPEDRKAAAQAKLLALGGVAPSPKLQAAAEKRKAEGKAVLSRVQSAKVAPRKPKAESPLAV